MSAHHARMIEWIASGGLIALGTMIGGACGRCAVTQRIADILGVTIVPRTRFTGA